MNELNSFLGLIAGIISFLAFIFYYYSILEGSTKPNRATWLILTIVGALIASSYYSVGARDTLWVALSYVLGPFIALLLSLKYGEGGWSSFDKWCLLGSGGGLLFWVLLKLPILTLVTNIIIDFFGILPTLKKSWVRPFSEALLPWLLTFIASILNMVALESSEFEIVIYPIYMLVFNGLVFGALLRGRFFSKLPKD